MFVTWGSLNRAASRCDQVWPPNAETGKRTGRDAPTSWRARWRLASDAAATKRSPPKSIEASALDRQAPGCLLPSAQTSRLHPTRFFAGRTCPCRVPRSPLSLGSRSCGPGIAAEIARPIRQKTPPALPTVPTTSRSPFLPLR